MTAACSPTVGLTMEPILMVGSGGSGVHRLASCIDFGTWGGSSGRIIRT